MTPAPLREKLLDGLGLLAPTWAAWMRNLSAALVYQAWSPKFTGLTEVGTVAKSGRYARVGNLLVFEVQVAPAAGGTSAAVLGTTRIANLPAQADRYGVLHAIDTSTRAALGVGLITAGARTAYMPAWAANGNTIAICGQVLVAG